MLLNSPGLCIRFMTSLSTSPQQMHLGFVDSITEIGAGRWNALAGTSNPFMRYEFLAALEETGCTTRGSGWQPHHVLVESTDTSGRPGDAIAVVPLYLKTNSWGEFVFDWSWANAYQQYGMDYYPKFVTSAPFTPSAGKRFFVAENHDPLAVMQLVQEKIQDKARFIGASSWHVLFPTPEQHELLNELDFMPRNACQFHWYNKDYRSFDEFLAAMSSRKRKNIRKERRSVADAGITFRRVEGADIDQTLWQEFYVFYNSTYLVRGMQAHLSQEFFVAVGKTMPEQLFMICAELGGQLIAAALFFKSDESLFGRYWGSNADYQFLHFETCYYQGQDYAIEHGFRHFDSGAQGEHKIQRGFEPITTYSNHWIANAGFRNAIAEFLDDEKRHIDRYGRAATELLPFKTIADDSRET